MSRGLGDVYKRQAFFLADYRPASDPAEFLEADEASQALPRRQPLLLREHGRADGVHFVQVSIQAGKEKTGVGFPPARRPVAHFGPGGQG